jgi:hypothetical protein
MTISTIISSNNIFSPGQKCWQTVLEIEISCSQWEGSVCTQSALIFFHFSLFPKCFLGSQCVPQGCSL